MKGVKCKPRVACAVRSSALCMTSVFLYGTSQRTRFLLSVMFLVFAVLADSLPSFRFALPGFDAFRNGDFRRAIADIWADTSVADSAVKLFRAGVAHGRAGETEQALFCLRLAAQKDTRIMPLAYEQIGDICAGRHQVENAILAYRAALSPNLPQRYAAALRKKMYNVLRADSTLAAQISWFQTEKLAPTASDDQWILPFLDTLIATGQWRLADSVVRISLQVPDANLRCRVCIMLEESGFPDSFIDTRRLFELSRLALECKMPQHARRWLDKAESRPDFSDSVSDRAALFHRGMIEYAAANYAAALKWLDKHEKNFGLTPQIVLTIARCYRRMNKTAKSNIWYDKLLEMYPNHAFANEVLWYRAWQKEEEGLFNEAIARYTAVYNRHPRAKQAEQAQFRSGLCRYKQGDYGSAAAAFDLFIKTRPSSPLVWAACYWRARSLLQQGKKREAAAILRSICDSAPFDYYALRSHQLLIELGDTSRGFCFDSTASTLAHARGWLYSIQQPAAISPTDSSLLFRGILLALSGMTDHAEIFLQPIESSYHKNLALQFDLVLLYDMCGEPTLSFRVARRFAWRIAEPYRRCMPLALYGMLYPLPFQDLIVEASLNNDVDPLLVCSVMRQESQFDPKVVSPAGAIGLMQIMPFTGQSVAKTLNEKFFLDSLYSPAANIRYGVRYLRELLDQFDGDVVSAAAGYNGGPHNVELWRARNRSTPTELFIENIGFTETREYVKKVLANYWVYEKIAPLLGYPSSSP